MPNSKDVFNSIVAAISLEEPIDEIESIVYALMESHFAISKSQIIAGQELNGFDPQILNKLIDRINLNEPIQYITGFQNFYGRLFKVTPSVLIPRPETEQLVQCVIQHAKTKEKNLSLLDIGTGSGCIPITLNLELQNIEAAGIDISEQAIEVSKENNRIHKTHVDFLVGDILLDFISDKKYDIIVSNPPYVTENEKPFMKANVLNFEPYSALFVPNNDPLIFYKAIAAKSKIHLTSGGMVAVEINEAFGNEVVSIFKESLLSEIELIKDLSGKNRMVKAIKN